MSLINPPPTPAFRFRYMGIPIEYLNIWIYEYMNIQNMEYLEISKYEKMRA